MTGSMKASKFLTKFLFYAGNIIIGIIFVSPLIWMISASLKPEAEIFANMNSIATFIPVDASLNNFDFKGRGLMLSFIVALMVMPMEAIMLPLYIEMSQIGWVNKLPALVVPFIAKCFSIYMFRQFFCDIPDELLEAASIDGSSPIRTFFTVVMPISKTVYATVFILDFVAHWNDFMWPFLVMTGESKRTIQLAIQVFFGTQPIHYSAIMAALVVSAIPMLVMFIFMQKYYIEGIASSGIKG